MTEENEEQQNFYVKNTPNARANLIQTLCDLGIRIYPETLSDIIHDPEYSSGALFEEKLSAASVLEDGHKTEHWRIYYSNLLNIATSPETRLQITSDSTKSHRYNTNGYTLRIAERLFDQYETIYSQYGSGDLFVCHMKNFTASEKNPFSKYTQKSFENRIVDTLAYLRLDSVYEMITSNIGSLMDDFWETVDTYFNLVTTTANGERATGSRLPAYFDDLRSTVYKRDIKDFYKFMFGLGTRGLGAFLPYEVDFFQKYIDYKLGTNETLSRLDEEMLIATLNSGFQNEELGMKNFSNGFEELTGIKTNNNVISAGRNILFRGLPINPKLAPKSKNK